MDFDIHKAKGHKEAGAPISWATDQCRNAVLEPKYDGWRVVFIHAPDGVHTYAARNRKEYTGQVPEIEEQIRRLPVGTILDGELVAMTMDGDGMWDANFTTVQTAMATKMDGPKAPAQKVARQQLRYIAFDIIQLAENRLADKPFGDRRAALEMAIAAHDLSPLVRPTLQMDATQAAHESLLTMGMEGSVVKCTEAPYGFGKKGHGMYKFKGTTTLDCVVMQLPVDGKGQYEGQVGRMVVGQLRDGQLVQRCKVNAPNNAERRAMTNRPDEYIGRVVEVKIYGFDPKTGNPRHPSKPRWREDKPAAECVWSDEQ